MLEIIEKGTHKKGTKTPTKKDSHTISQRIEAFKRKHPKYLGCLVYEMVYFYEIGKTNSFDSYGIAYDCGYMRGYEKAKRESRKHK